jgi:hypothetical protein
MIRGLPWDQSEIQQRPNAIVEFNRVFHGDGFLIPVLQIPVPKDLQLSKRVRRLPRNKDVPNP